MYFESIGHTVVQKFVPLSENSSPPVSQAGYGPGSPENVWFSFFPAETLSNS